MAEKRTVQSTVNEQSKISTLLKLKQWITLGDAAHHLSRIFEEEITEADLLQLAVSQHLRLSVRFGNGAVARPGKIVPIADAKFIELPSLDGKRLIRIPDEGIVLFSDHGVATHVLHLEQSVVNLNGVYDLPMIGAERLDIEHKYQMLVNGSPVTDVSLDGVFIEASEGVTCQLLEEFDNKFIKQLNSTECGHDPLSRYYPAGGLPDDAMLVVRIASLMEFEKSIQQHELSEQKPTMDKLDPRAETTYLNIIGGLLQKILEHPKPIYGNQADVKAALLASFPNTYGIKDRTLDEKFADAKRSLRSH